MPHLAFLGHSSTDKGIVLQIAAALRKRGIDYWLDSERIGAGDDIVTKIEEGLKASTAFVAFIGAEGEKGKWQGVEINTAIMTSTGDNKPLIPVLIDVATPDIVPIVMRRLLAVTFPSADYETALDELSEAIRKTDSGPISDTGPDIPYEVPYAYE